MPKITASHEFAMEIYRDVEPVDASQLLVQQELTAIDWQPALECAWWEAIRQRARRPLILDVPGGTVDPVWHAVLGRPYVEGFEVGLSVGGRDASRLTVPLAYVSPAAVSASQALVSAGSLANGDTVRYRVRATARAAARAAAAVPPPAVAGFSVDVVPEEAPVRLASLAAYLAGGEYRSGDRGASVEGDMPVFVPRAVLEEVTGLTRDTCSAETGGILIGNICLDERRGELFVEVTAQIAAAHAEEELTRLTFTPATWSAVDAARRLRNRGELYVGWWHSHPARQWCATCPEEKRAKCRATGEFFSAHDIALHRCCFPRAYSVALVISDATATGLTSALFGWRAGLVVRRGFHLVDGGLSAR
ncbi:MAG: hypothetical protein FJ276_26835 [Planctomycetes bacterium]|nr:hypothetical protein [Planctomycetota bacterium]